MLYVDKSRMEEKKYHVVEWTIVNFSCWNSEIHEKVIKSPKSPYAWGITFHLFPRGLNGHDEHLLVQIQSNGILSIPREVSFVCSDGSILCTQQVDSKEEQGVLELRPGLKFKEMVAHIRKAFLKNQIILRLRIKRLLENNTIEHMCTTINAFEASFKVSPNILSDTNSSNTVIGWLVYPVNEENIGHINLLASKSDQLDDSKIELSLKADLGIEKVSVLTCLFVVNNEEIVRFEENEHLYRDNSESSFCNFENYQFKDGKWIFSNSLTREEVTDEGLSIILTINIIPVNSYNDSAGLFSNSVGLKLYYTDALHRIKLNEIKPAGTLSKSRSSDNSNHANNSLRVLSSELMCLYQDQDFSDFQLKCGDVSYPVHKNILSARSPVFKTMLTTDMKEAASGCMDIVDLDPSTLALFLTYLYSGAVEGLQGESALKLYYASDKYQVPTLKKECVDFLRDNVSVSNVCDILSLADKHHDETLTNVAHDFILKHFTEVLRSKEWKSFMKSEPMMAAETLTHLADKNLDKRS